MLKAVSVCDVVDGNGDWLCADPRELARNIGLLRKIAPTQNTIVRLSGHQVRIRVVGNQNGDGDLKDCYDLLAPFDGKADSCEAKAFWSQIVGEIHRLHVYFDLFMPVSGQQSYYYGMVRPDLPGGGPLGMARLSGRGGASVTNSVTFGVNDTQDTVAHEVGHMLGIRHTDEYEPDITVSGVAPGCWDSRDDENTWPYDDNLLRSGPAPGQVEVGFDVAKRAVVLPESNFEVMGYCIPGWISPHTYLGMLDILDPPPSSPAGTPGTFWQVAGTIEGGSAALRSLFTFDTLGLDDAGTGTHRLEVRDGGGSVLYTRFFTPSVSESRVGPGEAEVEGTPTFAELIPLQVGAATIVVIDDASTEVGQITFGSTASVVDIISLAGGETLGGPQAVTWTVTDPDSSSHTFQVWYSPDGGTSWQSLTANEGQTSTRLDFATLPGSSGTARVKVTASDGVNTGEATSNAFFVPMKLPSAEILFPEDGSAYRPGELVWFQGLAADWDEGIITGTPLQWDSSLDGVLGSGEELPLTTLSEGAHTITLSATDTDGNPASDTITLDVAAAPLSETLPAPTPTPTPTPVPGLGAWGLVVMAVVLGAVVFAMRRRRTHTVSH